MNTQIGTLNETALHAAIKDWYSQPGDFLEIRVDGYQIDIIRGELLIEIQTGHFSSIKNKLLSLLENHPIHLVHPIPVRKWILRLDTQDGGVISRRLSPRRGKVEDLFYELVRIPALITHPNFSLEVLLTHEEELRIKDGRGSWRKAGWRTIDRRLLQVVSQIHFTSVQNYRMFVPAGFSGPFSTREIADSLSIHPKLAYKMVYCLKSAGILKLSGQRGRSNLYLSEDLH